MSLMRWDPFGGLSRMHDEIDRMFEDFFTGTPRTISRVAEGLRVPSVDIEETDKAVIVRAELPGVKKDNLEVEIAQDALTIKGEATRNR